MLDEATLIKTLGPLLTGAASFLFGVPVTALIAGFAGAWLAVALTESVTFRRALVMILLGTVVAGFLTPAAQFFIGDIPHRPVAGIIGFIAIHKESRGWLIERVRGWLSFSRRG